MTNQAVCIHAVNPLAPAAGRKVMPIRSGLSITGLCNKKIQQSKDIPFVCILNGKPLMRKYWSKKVKKGDVVVFLNLPRGGGAGGDNTAKNAFITIVGVAIAVAGVVSGNWWITAAGIGVASVGAAGFLLPPQNPSTDNIPQPSPTYSLTSQGNRARLGSAIPVVYGRMRVFPDYIEAPWSNFQGDVNNCHQYLHQYFGITQGAANISDIRIEDTPIAEFSEITTQVKASKNRSAVSLFRESVITSPLVSGQRLDTRNEWLGPFWANDVDQTINYCEVDISFPQGAYHISSSGNQRQKAIGWTIQFRKEGQTQWQEVRHSDSPLTFNSICYSFTLVFNPVDGTPGRWQVRMKNDVGADPRNQDGDAMHWTQLKAGLVNRTASTNMTRLAMKAKATNNLSSRSSSLVNMIVERKIPKWSKNGGWSAPVVTANPVWVACDILRDSTYGIGAPDTIFNLPVMEELATQLDTEGREFNGVFDRSMSIWEALRLVCRAARCAPVWQGGQFYMVPDREQTIPAALFSPHNIVEGSFSISYQMPEEDEPDGYQIDFIDAADGYKPSSIRASLNATGKNLDLARPERVEFFGCTDLECATQEAKYLIRNQAYRRKIIKLTTELEGYIPAFGDLVYVSHDMPSWGKSGEVVGVEIVNGTAQIELSEPFEFAAGKSYCILFRDNKGGIQKIPTAAIAATTRGQVIAGGLVCPIFETQPSNPNKINLSKLITRTADGIEVDAWSKQGDSLYYTIDEQSPSFKIYELYTGTERERTMYVIGEHTREVQKGIVKSIRPRGETQVELEIIGEDNRVHAA